MQITKKSLITGIVRTVEMDITQDQFDQWQGGALIQVVMPNLSTDEREFLISGTIPDEWQLLEDKENQETL